MEEKDKEQKPTFDCVEEYLCNNQSNPCPELGYVLIRKYNKSHPFFKNCFCENAMFKAMKAYSYFSSPFISKLIEFKDTDEFVFVVMEYPPGIPLLELVKNTKLKHEDLHNIFRQVAIAIKHTVLRDLSIGYLTLDNIIIE